MVNNVIKLNKAELNNARLNKVDLSSTDLGVPEGSRSEIEVMTFKKPLLMRIKKWFKRA